MHIHESVTIQISPLILHVKPWLGGKINVKDEGFANMYDD